VFIALSVLSAYELRQNNLHMVSLRTQLYQVDENNGNVNQALNNLRLYVYSHMNTNLSSGNNGIYPPIQLKFSYQRLVAAAKLQTITENNQNFITAQNQCQKQGPNYTVKQLATCEEQYYLANPVTLVSIPPALYEYDFISPIWSPDLAGFSILVTGITALAIILLIIDRYVVRKI
jgi:hypothetical protein